LWHRIQQHDFEPDTPLKSTDRLARRHGWSREHARAAIDAYRRFCFLAVVSPTPVTPSEVVDEVWHQHLIYSRDYWTVWCGDRLQISLHHDPSPGGSDAQMNYRRQYAETLALHERFFRTTGFGTVARNLSALRTPALSCDRPQPLACHAQACCLVSAPPSQGEPMTWNPFNWTAEPFLAVYITVAAIFFAWGFLIRLRIGPPAHMTHQLNVLELAYLAGGAGRLGDAILLGLASGNGATIAAAGDNITVTSQTPLAFLIGGQPSQLSFEPGMTRKKFQTPVKPIIQTVQDRLQKLGYTPSDAQMALFRWNVLPFVGLLIAFGATRVFVGGIERHHPVGFLAALLLITALLGIFLAIRPTRTLAGKEALQSYQESHARAARAPLEHELLVALALSGSLVLSGTAYASVYAASKTVSSGSDGGGGGCGGGGGGCGGCSCSDTALTDLVRRLRVLPNQQMPGHDERWRYAGDST
jgi:uncharacterized protein (TIGR04222 family)